MNIKLTYNGKEHIIENVSIGGLIQWTYTTSQGKTKHYCIRITDKEASVMN